MSVRIGLIVGSIFGLGSFLYYMYKKQPNKEKIYEETKVEEIETKVEETETKEETTNEEKKAENENENNTILYVYITSYINYNICFKIVINSTINKEDIYQQITEKTGLENNNNNSFQNGYFKIFVSDILCDIVYPFHMTIISSNEFSSQLKQYLEIHNLFEKSVSQIKNYMLVTNMV